MDTGSDIHNRLLWRGALSIYRATMWEVASAERAATIAYAWDFLTTEGCETFPPTLMRPTQIGVTSRLVSIANRGRWGMPLVPELAN